MKIKLLAIGILFVGTVSAGEIPISLSKVNEIVEQIKTPSGSSLTLALNKLDDRNFTQEIEALDIIFAVGDKKMSARFYSAATVSFQVSGGNIREIITLTQSSNIPFSDAFSKTPTEIYHFEITHDGKGNAVTIRLFTEKTTVIVPFGGDAYMTMKIDNDVQWPEKKPYRERISPGF